MPSICANTSVVPNSKPTLGYVDVILRLLALFPAYASSWFDPRQAVRIYFEMTEAFHMSYSFDLRLRPNREDRRLFCSTSQYNTHGRGVTYPERETVISASANICYQRSTARNRFAWKQAAKHDAADPPRLSWLSSGIENACGAPCVFCLPLFIYFV